MHVPSDIPMLRTHVHCQTVPINIQFITLSICFETHLVVLLSSLLCIYLHIVQEIWRKRKPKNEIFSFRFHHNMADILLWRWSTI